LEILIHHRRRAALRAFVICQQEELVTEEKNRNVSLTLTSLWPK
jgi:hypothetical protein